MDEIQRAKAELKEVPELDLNAIENLQNDIDLLETSYEELNLQLRTLEGKERWIKSLLTFQKT